METVDESIDNKSQRLFKIRYELSKLFEQARILQSEINQLSTTQVENIREFLLLCKHLDTYPKQNLILKGNINPSKVAEDVPLALSAQNISKVSTDMPNPISKDNGKSRAIIEASTSKEGTSSSSAKPEKPISGKPGSKTNQVPSGTKVFSSFQVGKQLHKEEEYLTYTRYVYNLPEESGETFGVLGTTNRVYAKQDLKEISQLPTKLFNSVKNYAQEDDVYCIFYSISMECKHLQVYYPTLNYISVEKIKDFNFKAIGVDKKLPHLNKKWIQTKQALGIKALYFILKRFYNEDCRVIDQNQDWVLITKGKSKSKELEDRILDIELHILGATKETWKLRTTAVVIRTIHRIKEGRESGVALGKRASKPGVASGQGPLRTGVASVHNAWGPWGLEDRDRGATKDRRSGDGIEDRRSGGDIKDRGGIGKKRLEAGGGLKTGGYGGGVAASGHDASRPGEASRHGNSKSGVGRSASRHNGSLEVGYLEAGDRGVGCLEVSDRK
ncbi:hypothetical protein H5410_037865 [Solanum commersonii]|uniref:Uncharacterized protein n=1 Tax=Solanum commersonii TaxID=4109 RepID=A0A9J5Y8E6_SOLCO|nr:hypothetical protein H5410_037865 [Solanum commersonii]